MKSHYAIASAMFALALGASGAHAQQGPNGALLAGSDTLFQVTKDMLLVCPNSNSLSYVGGGSGNGENAMRDRATGPMTNQYIAPMSRFLKTGAVFCPATAQGYNIALDGLSIVRDNNSTVGCDTAAYTSTIACPGCNAANSWTFHDFRDVLRIVYAGIEVPTNIAACFTGEPSRTAMSAQNCNSPVRQAVLNNWGNLFQNPSCAAGETCTQLKHAFRRSDLSGTTDVFLTLLGLPKLSVVTPIVKPFCNGADHEDKDPIRRTCTGNGGNTNGEQVCQAREATAMAFPASNTSPLGPPSTPWEPAVNKVGDLGVVQDILIPEGVAASVSHNVNTCNFGSFDLVHMPGPFQLAGTRCPNGTPQVLLKCLYPKDTAGNFGCLNTAVNVPPIGELKQIDGRVYNLILRSGPNPDDNIVKDQNGKLVTGAFYRIHDTKVMPGSNGVPCTQQDSTAQIGCLVQASPCSIGFAGREAADDPSVGNNDVRSLLIGAADNSMAVAPTDSAVQQLLGTCGGTPNLTTRYPLARQLWINSIGGFSDASMPLDQQALAGCFKDRGRTDSIAKANGFIPLPQPAGTNCLTAGPGVPACQQTAVSQPCL